MNRIAQVAAMALLSALLLGIRAAAQAQATRDPWQWPFAATSLWNTPIGSGAQYVAANLGTLDGVYPDPEFMVRVTNDDALRTIYYPGSPYRADGTQVAYLGSIRVPDGFLVADVTYQPYSTPNDCSTFLQPDGLSMLQLQPTTRLSATGPIWGYPQFGQNAGGSLFSEGAYGTHYGSGLSAIGGSLRPGEISGPNPIRHALKFELSWAKLYHNPADPTNDYQTYRWPAKNSDGGADNSQGGYYGTNPAVQMGSLLAADPSQTEQSLGLTTAAGKKLFHAIQDYGAYIVDTSSTSGNGINIAGEDGLQNEISGWGNSGAFYADLNQIYTHLSVVNNNAPGVVGGGGLPRITTPVPSFAYGGEVVGQYALAVPGVVEAENYDAGGDGVGYHDTDAVNIGGAYRDDGVDIYADPNAGGGFYVGQTAPGEWLNYSVVVQTAGTYTLTLTVSGGSGTVHLEDENGVNLSGSITLPGSGSVYTTVSAPGLTLSGGDHTLKIVVDSGSPNLDTLTWTATATTPPTASAAFVKTDTSTQGNWKGVYGGDGFDLSQDPSANNPTVPAYATLSLSDVSNSVWAASTTDVRALLKSAPGTTDRLAASWYSEGSFDIDIVLGDGQTHQVALYGLDWDNYGPRIQTVQVLDAGTGDVLDTQTLADFVNGKYLVWSLRGHVRLHLVNAGGPTSNVVLSGLFFDTAVARANTTLAVTPIFAPPGQTVTLKATLKRTVGGAALSNETITFSVDGASVGTAVTNSDGQAGLTYVTPASNVIGSSHPVSAVFGGDSSDNASSGSASLTVTRYNSTLGVASVTSTPGQTVTLSATLRRSTGLPLSGQTVSFTVDSTPLTVTTNAAGVATVPYVIPAADAIGSHTIMASFGGDASDNAVTNHGTLSVKYATVLAAANVSGARGTAVTLTATLTSGGAGIAGKSVSFKVDGKAAGSSLTDATGTANVSYGIPGTDKVGSHVLSDSFAGGSADNPATGTGTLTVN